MASRVSLNLRGLEQLGKSQPVADAVQKRAERVAEAVQALGIYVEGVPGDVALPVKVETGDAKGMRVGRARAAVVIAHPSGKAVQAKHGALTKAAARVGLKVRSR